MDINYLLNFISIAEISLVIDLLKLKEIQNVVNINCDGQKSIFHHKILNDNNIHASYWSLNSTDQNMMQRSYHKTGVILDASCSNWEQALNNFDNSMFRNEFIWLIITEDLLSTARSLSNCPIEIDSDVTVALKTNGIFMLYEVFHTNYSSGVISIRNVGYWDTTLHIATSSRRDLQGLKMRCPVVVTDKVVHQTFEEYLSKHQVFQVDSLHKLKFVALLNYIRDMYNMSYELQRTNSWGYMRNGSFDGVVGSLQRQHADFGGSPLFFRADRAELIDYIAETWQSRQCFILRHPKHPGGYYTIYTRPLTAKVWYCILAMLIFSGVILCLMLKTKVTQSHEKSTDSSFSLALLFAWSAICQQGMTVNRSSTSVKIVVIVTFVYAVTLYQYYNATVVSTLLREPPKNIRTLEDLLQSNLKAGAENVLYTKDYFKRTTDPVALRMYHKKIAPKHQYNFYSPEYGMSLVKQGGFAFHVDSVVAYRIMRKTFTEREICEAHEVLLYPPQKMGMVVRKASPYKEHFTYGIRKIYEAGLMDRLQSVWDEPKPSCVHTPDSSVFSVSIVEFSTALLALVAGNVAAILVLFAEIVLHRCEMKKRIAFTH
ncbi:ionotropic receptor 75a-like [Ostrinia nubilalis]|uniref:ionotropic receptor 75a-like n=1 Tax=Ostrinia nubilalis TaxID=29057 RepID=UPI00308257C5